MNMENLIVFNNEKDKKYIIDQYKMVADSLNKVSDVRETSNNFWTGINGAFLSLIAYIKDIGTLQNPSKELFLWTLIVLGCFLSFTWFGSILTIKRTEDMKNKMLIEFEKYLPAKPFTVEINALERKKKIEALTFKELRVPFAFLIGYIFFATMLLIYPSEILP